MKRKLVKQGQGALTITLPKEWINKKKLEAGSYVEVVNEEGTLKISTNRIETKKKSFNVEKPDRVLLRTIISSYYRRGFDLKLEFKEKLPLAMIQNVTENLYGLEIEEINEHSCTLKQISTEKQKSENLICKLLYYTIEMFEAIVSRSKEADINALRKNVFKMRDYTLRIIVVEDSKLAFELYTLVIFLEKIGAECYYFSKSTAKLTPKDEEMIVNLKDFLVTARQVVRKKDFSEARALYERGYELMKTDQYKIKEQSKADIFRIKVANLIFGICSRLQNICS